MASPLQNRIVGTVIVVALAVIILPDLFDGQNMQREDELQVSPLRPQIDTEFEEAEFPEEFEQLSQRQRSDVQITPVDEPEPEQVDSDSEDNANTTAEVSDAVEQEETQADQSPEFTSEAYVVQLGAFRNQQTVSALVDELQAAGYSAYSRRIQGSNGELLLLLVGPDLERDKLEQQLPALKEITELEGRIVRYQPASNG